jgi:hypothetical protein
MESADKKDKLENPGGKEVMTDLGGEKSGLPFFAFLDEKGKKLANSNALPGEKNIGYPASPEEIDVFEGLLKKTAPKMKSGDRTKLIEHLREVGKKLTQPTARPPQP